MEFRHKKRRMAAVGATAAVILVLAAGGVALAYWTSSGSGTGAEDVGSSTPLVIRQTNDVLYDSTVSPLPGTLPSAAFQATGTSELGNEITLADAAPLGSVTVTMDSWTCQNWASGSTPCTTTTPGAGYFLPITLTIYNATAGGVVGAPIESVTRTFEIPYRPSADSSTCSSSTGTTGWFDTTATADAFGVTPDTKCEYGLDHNITFNFTTQKVLPTTVSYGISFNTQSYGTSPVGHATPQTSLNVALTTTALNPSVGTDVYPGELDLRSANAEFYCDDADPGTFRLDAPQEPAGGCTGAPQAGWSAGSGQWYLPAVKFTAASTASQDLFPGGPSQPIDFTVTNPGSGTEHVSSVGIALATLPASCTASWFTVTGPSITAQTIPAGGTVHFDTKATIKMDTSGTTQDACQNGKFVLKFTST